MKLFFSLVVALTGNVCSTSAFLTPLPQATFSTTTSRFVATGPTTQAEDQQAQGVVEQEESTTAATATATATATAIPNYDATLPNFEADEQRFKALRTSPPPHASPKSFATKCATLFHPSPDAARGLAPPVYFGSTFLLDNAAHGARLHEKRESPYTDADGFVYSRWGAPTNEAAALQMAALEGVDDPERGLGKSLLFNSGMSAITSALMSVLRAGDHVVAPYTVYGGTHEFLTEFAANWGVQVTFVDASGVKGPENYRQAFRENTKVVYTETPANPTMR